MAANKNIVLVMGRPSAGKTFALQGLQNPEQWAYANCDLKELSYRNDKFLANIEIKTPDMIDSFIDTVENSDKCVGGIIDTLTFLMGMYERQIVDEAPQKYKMQAWGQYGIFYNNMIHKLKAGNKNYIILAHDADEIVEQADGSTTVETKVPIKGASGKRGVEGDFTHILRACRMPVTVLDNYPNDLLHISERDRRRKNKYVFQTDFTSDTINHKIRAPWEMYKEEELYIDNDFGQVFTRIHAYNNNLDY